MTNLNWKDVQLKTGSISTKFNWFCHTEKGNKKVFLRKFLDCFLVEKNILHVQSHFLILNHVENFTHVTISTGFSDTFFVTAASIFLKLSIFAQFFADLPADVSPLILSE